MHAHLHHFSSWQTTIKPFYVSQNTHAYTFPFMQVYILLVCWTLNARSYKGEPYHKVCSKCPLGSRWLPLDDGLVASCAALNGATYLSLRPEGAGSHSWQKSLLKYIINFNILMDTNLHPYGQGVNCKKCNVQYRGQKMQAPVRRLFNKDIWKACTFIEAPSQWPNTGWTTHMTSPLYIVLGQIDWV